MTVVEAMQWAKRWSLDTKFPEVSNVCKPLFDTALEKTWLFMKSEDHKLSTDTWFEKYTDVMGLGLALPTDALQKCVQHTGAWTDIADSLADVTKTKIGFTIFNKALKSLNGNKVHDYIVLRLTWLSKQVSIIKAMMDKEENDFCGVVQAYNKDPVETFAKAKRITPMYRGRPSPCTAKSF